MPDLCVTHPPGYEPERRYALHVVLSELLGLTFAARPEERDDVRITLAAEADGPALIVPDGLFGAPADAWLTRSSLPRLPLKRVSLPDDLAGAVLVEPAGALPVLWGTDAPLLQRAGKDTVLALDVFGGAFFMLTRYEEAVEGGPRDERGRFPDESSIAVREGFVRRPIVNEYAEVLRAALRRLWPGLPERRRPFQVFLTHDVDWPLATVGRNAAQVAKHVALDVVGRRNPGVAAARLASWWRTRGGDARADLWNSFDFILDTAERAGQRAALYFIPERLAGKLDGSCSIDDPFIRRLIKQVYARGHEIGLHTSYAANADPTLIRRQFDRLQQVCRVEGVEQEAWGGRQHYLRWQNPETWQGWDSAGLTYDSSLGWVRHIGFRAGTCYEYPAFNLRTHEQLRLRERPLLVMEQAAFHEYGGRLDAAAGSIIDLARTARRFGGEFVLLWHNNWLATRAERRWFRTVVDEIGSGSGWWVRGRGT